MKQSSIFIAFSVLLLGCVSKESEVRNTLKNHPDIFFKVIEENPEQFIEVVNRAAKSAQQKQYERQVEGIRAAQERELKEPKTPELLDERRLAGDKNAKITVVEYADFQCPACGMAYETLNTFQAKYKDKIQFFYKHMPLDFHKLAYPAAKYFEAIRLQDRAKAKQFYELVFENQRGMSGESFLKEMARRTQADLKRLQMDLNSDEVKRVIEADMKEFEKFGFTGTPVVLINGVALHGAQGIEELERVAKLTGGL